MSITSWHMQDDNLNRAPKQALKTSKIRTTYSDADVDRFCELILDGYSVAKAVKMTGLTLTKGYSLAARQDIKDIYEQHRRMGFKK